METMKLWDKDWRRNYSDTKDEFLGENFIDHVIMQSHADQTNDFVKHIKNTLLETGIEMTLEEKVAFDKLMTNDAFWNKGQAMGLLQQLRDKAEDASQSAK